MIINTKQLRTAVSLNSSFTGISDGDDPEICAIQRIGLQPSTPIKWNVAFGLGEVGVDSLRSNDTWALAVMSWERAMNLLLNRPGIQGKSAF
jgi:hypothetical protein